MILRKSARPLKEKYKVKEEKFESHPVHNMDQEKVRVDIYEKEEKYKASR